MNLARSMAPLAELSGNALYYIFSGNEILIKTMKDQTIALPLLEDGSALAMGLQKQSFLGHIDATACYSAYLPSKAGPLPDRRYQWINLRALYGNVPDSNWHAAGYARQINDFHLDFAFCGRCGKKNQRLEKEHARHCQSCGLTVYPRVSPAIITAVVKADKILLARGVRFPNKIMFSVLAGFVEPSETLEECVMREIYEESGIRVKNIQYFGSQPWPFPDSLMIGFTAEYKSGSITIDPEEILEAGWFTADALPVVPKNYTLAGQLIDWFVQQQQTA